MGERRENSEEIRKRRRRYRRRQRFLCFIIILAALALAAGAVIYFAPRFTPEPEYYIPDGWNSGKIVSEYTLYS